MQNTDWYQDNDEASVRVLLSARDIYAAADS